MKYDKRRDRYDEKRRESVTVFFGFLKSGVKRKIQVILVKVTFKMSLCLKIPLI